METAAERFRKIRDWIDNDKRLEWRSEPIDPESVREVYGEHCCEVCFDIRLCTCVMDPEGFRCCMHDLYAVFDENKITHCPIPEHVILRAFGRIGRGRRLLDEEVMEMRSLRRRGWSFRALSDRFSASDNALRKAAYGQSYTHLPGAITDEEERKLNHKYKGRWPNPDP